MEKDDEVEGVGNSYTTLFRQYDPRLGRWFSLDPLMQHHSLYLGLGNNPISRIDPDGGLDWEPDKDGNLIAEKGDSPKTLAEHYSMTVEEATELINSYLADIDGSGTISQGDKLWMDNVYTRAIQKIQSTYTHENYVLEYEAGRRYIGKKPDPERDDYFNCFGTCIYGSSGAELGFKKEIKLGKTFDEILDAEFGDINPKDAIFGKTVIRFESEDDNTTADHAAIFYGTNNAGEVFVATKNGYHQKLTVMRLSELIEYYGLDFNRKEPGYGTVKGLKPSHSGWYNRNTID